MKQLQPGDDGYGIQRRLKELRLLAGMAEAAFDEDSWDGDRETLDILLAVARDAAKLARTLLAERDV